MGQLEPDRIEHELRDVLTHERRALSTDLVSLESVYAGAARRRRRRTAVISSAGALLLAAVAVPASLFLLNNSPNPSPIETADKTSPTVQVPKQTASSGPTTPTPSKSAVTTAIPVGPAWDGARVASMTATSTRTIVVLGFLGDTGACKPPNCVRLVQSHDGGRTYTALPVPDDVVAGDSDQATAKTATDVRFGSATDGWLFGSGLWATHNGARTWHKVTLPGTVSRLAAGRGTVWALVSTDRGNTQQLWRSPVGSDSWTQVPDVTVGAPGDLALVGARVVVLGAGPSKVWVSKSGSSFSSYASPCNTALAAEMSASTSLWGKCVTGTAAYVVTSTTGTSWRQVRTTGDQGSLPNSLALGARGPKDALLAVGGTEPLADLYADGHQQSLSKPPTAGSSISYLGFTTVDIGYAIDGTHLWRTTDGGDTWSRLRIA